LMPEDEMKSAFINLCAPDWQQEFLKTGINEYPSTWVEILAKAKALEQAEVAIAEMAPTPTKESTTKHDQEDNEIANKQGFKKKAKTAFYCKMHGPDQRHNTNGCKVINAEIEELKGQKPPPYNNQQQGSEAKKWTDNKNKRPSATTYTTKQLKEVVWTTRKKAMQDAKTKFDAQVQDELHALEIHDNAVQELQKMNNMKCLLITRYPVSRVKATTSLLKLNLKSSPFLFQIEILY
jgi:hypothetical protein